MLDVYRRDKPSPDAFAGLDVLFVQHHLGPLVPRIKAMEGDGLELERCFFVDIPYSTNGLVREELRSLGCHVSNEFMDPLEPYSRAQLKRTRLMVSQLLTERESGQLLVVDDGAYFLRSLHDLSAESTHPDIRDLAKHTHVVEQTTRGYRYLQETDVMETIQEFGIPVVTTARNYTKAGLETPFIGAAVARAMSDRLIQEERHEAERSLIIGFGEVGSEVTHALRDLNPKGTIDVFDTNPELAPEISDSRANALRSLPEAGPYDLVIGCTGYASFPLEERSILADDAVLASGSSAAVELNREKFVELADAKPDDEIEILNREATKNDGIHATIQFRDQDRQFSFLNAGFPVNFTGDLECLPALLIQPTHALLFAACRQALKMNEPGVAYLNSDDDFWIYRNGRKMIEDFAR